MNIYIYNTEIDIFYVDSIVKLGLFKNQYLFMSIPNVYPGPLRSVKQPGKAKTI